MVYCEFITVMKQFLHMSCYQTPLSWFPFDNSLLNRRESKEGGEEDTRTEMLMVRFLLTLPGFCWHAVEAFPPSRLLTHLLSLIQDIITVYQRERACKCTWFYLIDAEKKPSFSQRWARIKCVSLVRNCMESLKKNSLHLPRQKIISLISLAVLHEQRN